MAYTTSGPRTNISPSDLTFNWDGCHRCLWLYYNHQIKAPVSMPLVGELADMQERSCLGKTSEELHPDLPTGKAIEHGGWVLSKNIMVNGKESDFSIRGKYDLLMEFPDGTYGIIDCKFQAKANDKSGFYSPQLEAYAFALENPAKDQPKRISHIGLLVWSPVKVRGVPAGNFGLELQCNWFPIERNPQALTERLTDFITMVTGEIPASKNGCEQCRYIATRHEIVALE